MKHKKRPRVQIILEILTLLKKGERSKTNIVYQANLNFPAADRHLTHLVEKGLIVWSETTRLWNITPAGEQCLATLARSLAAIEAVL